MFKRIILFFILTISLSPAEDSTAMFSRTFLDFNTLDESIEPEIIYIENLYLCKWCGVKVILDTPQADEYEEVSVEDESPNP